MWLQSLQAAATNTVTDPVAWYNVVGQFKQEAAKFNTAWNDLLSNQQFVAQHPELMSEYQSLVSLGQSTKSKIQYITGLIDQTMNMVGSAWNTVTNDVQSVVKSIFGNVERGQGLGFVFTVLVPIAVITASVGAITYFVTKTYAFNQKIASMKQMEAQGVSAQQAYAATIGKPGSSPSTLTQVKNIAVPVLGIGALILFLGVIRKAEH